MPFVTIQDASSPWGFLAQKIFKDRHRLYRKRLYQAWRGNKGRSSFRDEVLLTIQHAECHQNITGKLHRFHLLLTEYN